MFIREVFEKEWGASYPKLRLCSCCTRESRVIFLNVVNVSAECGVRCAECGVRIADCGLRIADCGLRSVESK